jgi:hypothetical protein
MTPAETTDLLRLVQSLDNRQLEEITALAWAEVLANVAYQDAYRAVIAHFSDPDHEYFMPKHVIRHVNEVEAARRAERDRRHALVRANYPASLPWPEPEEWERIHTMSVSEWDAWVANTIEAGRQADARQLEEMARRHDIDPDGQAA